MQKKSLNTTGLWLRTFQVCLMQVIIALGMFTFEAHGVVRGDEVLQLKAKKDNATKLYGFENSGDKYYWWAEAHYLGSGKEQLNQGYETQWVIAPQYDRVAKEFSEGLAAVELNGKVGFIDRNNRYIIPPVFESSEDLYGFRFGLSAVKKDGKYGYIDKKGVFVFPPVFDDAENFGDDYLAVVKIGKKFGCIDLFGDTVVPFDYLAKEIMKTVPLKNKPYREAKKRAKERWEQGFYDDFREDIEATAASVNAVIADVDYLAPEGDVQPKGGVAAAHGIYIVTNNFGSQGAIDSYGRTIIPCNYKFVRYEPVQRLFVVENNSSPFADGHSASGVMNSAGGWIIPPVFESIGSFGTDGYASVSIGDHKGKVNVFGMADENFLQSMLENSIEEKGTFYTRRLIGVLPTCAPAHNCLGIYYASDCDDLKNAIHHFVVAHDLDPENEDYKTNMKAAKGERNSRRWNKVLTGMTIAAAVLSAGAVAYSAAKGVPMNSSSFNSSGTALASSDYSSDSSGSSHRSASSASKEKDSKGTSPADAANIQALRRSYDNYESMVVDCNVYPEKHKPGDKREYQQKMREIRMKLKNKYGVERSQSPHETN